MTPQEIKALVAFHNRHDKSSGTCAWCDTRVPSEKLTPFPKTINAETGMVDQEEPICDECAEAARKQQQETDEGYVEPAEYEHGYFHNGKFAWEEEEDEEERWFYENRPEED